jgi:hypothetical protein
VFILVNYKDYELFDTNHIVPEVPPAAAIYPGSRTPNE